MQAVTTGDVIALPPQSGVAEKGEGDDGTWLGRRAPAATKDEQPLGLKTVC